MARAAVRIVYLALADARGHLMRAHLVRGLLAPHGIVVEVVTTSLDGQRFLAALGTPSRLLSEHFRVAFGGCHDMSRSRTDACVLRYYLDPRRGFADLRRIVRWARGAELVVSDSLHPALLVAPWIAKLRVVHVFGENIWATALENFSGRAPAWFDRIYRAALMRMRDAAFGCIVHSLEDELERSERTIALSPILPAPRRRPSDVRAAFGLAPGDRLAAVYLNPHFDDPAVAAAIERVLRARGFAIHAVGEGYRDRAGWVPRDPDLASVVRAADLFVSGAGMGALAQCRVFGTPLVALLGQQPEQRKNARAMARSRAPFAAISLAAPKPNLEAALDAAVSDVTSPRLRVLTDSALDVHRAWADAFVHFVERATKENQHHESQEPVRLARDRNQQSPRRTERSAHREPRAAARAPRASEPTPILADRARGHA